MRSFRREQNMWWILGICRAQPLPQKVVFHQTDDQWHLTDEQCSDSSTLIPEERQSHHCLTKQKENSENRFTYSFNSVVYLAWRTKFHLSRKKNIDKKDSLTVEAKWDTCRSPSNEFVYREPFFATSPGKCVDVGVQHFNRCCSTRLLLLDVFFHNSAISCEVVLASDDNSMHITKNLSFVSTGIWWPCCNTTLMTAFAPGARIPVLGRTRNFSGDVVLICGCKWFD